MRLTGSRGKKKGLYSRKAKRPMILGWGRCGVALGHLFPFYTRLSSQDHTMHCVARVPILRDDPRPNHGLHK